MRRPEPWWRHKSYRYRAHQGLGPRATFTIALLFAVVCIILVGAATAFGNEVAVGDSLAVGFGHASGMPTRAIVGISSCRIAGMVPAGHYDFMLISAGTNDPPGRCVEEVRARADASVVEWVVPVNGARSTVLRVAAAHGDRTLFYTPGGRSWPHPAAYFNVHGGAPRHGAVHHRQHRRRHH